MPREGHDNLVAFTGDEVGGISIHVPREGHDIYSPTTQITFCDFNPRAPRGARQTSSNIVTIKLEFQSTCPARGTTINVHRAISTHSNFNPRAPRGARLMVLLVFMILKHFNPRAPRGARPSKNDGIHIQSNYFNPRAPRGARPNVIC